MPDKLEYKLDGTAVTVPDLPLTLLISTLRDRIISHMDSTVPASRLRFTYGNKVLTNSQTLASSNLDDGDLLILGLREAKKK